MEECEQVILEANGTITVIPRRPTAGELNVQAVSARLARMEEMLRTMMGRTAG